MNPNASRAASARPGAVDAVLAALTKDLDDGPTLALLALADRYEELGEERLAWGYRWLVENRKWPVWSESRWRWAWPEWYQGESPPSRGLPGKTWQWLNNRPGEVGSASYEFRTRGAAFRAAAEALAATVFAPEAPL